jgi:hypothetical protein
MIPDCRFLSGRLFLLQPKIPNLKSRRLFFVRCDVFFALFADKSLTSREFNRKEREEPQGFVQAKGRYFRFVILDFRFTRKIWI